MSVLTEMNDVYFPKRNITTQQLIPGNSQIRLKFILIGLTEKSFFDRKNR